jgi:hypothetical protein
LVAEDFACDSCGFAFPDCDVTTVAARLPTLAADVRVLIEAAGRDRLGAKPDDGSWSAIEYLCHLRDVYEVSAIRLYRVRTEDRPQLEPMYNDLRAIRFRYAGRDAPAVLDELDAAVAGCCDEIARVTDWDRTMTRLAGEHRTARWLARAAVHEGVHHLRDLHAALST